MPRPNSRRAEDENDIVAAIAEFESLWESLFPAEQARIARLLINWVVVSFAELTVDLRSEGLGSLVRDLLGSRQQEKACVTTAPTSLTVFIPLTVRRTGGRARIVPPAGMVPSHDDGVDSRVLKAIARAWSWRRRLESGEASTIPDIAQAEGVTDRFVSRMIRLARLSPAVLEKLVLDRCAPAVSIKEMIEASELPWEEQEAEAFSLAQ